MLKAERLRLKANTLQLAFATTCYQLAFQPISCNITDKKTSILLYLY